MDDISSVLYFYILCLFLHFHISLFIYRTKEHGFAIALINFVNQWKKYQFFR